MEMPWKKENKMNKKEMKEELVARLRKRMDTNRMHIYQDRPWTFVHFEVPVPDDLYETFGFSKVCRPDKWDADYGKELAVTKALYKLAKEILAKEGH